MALEQQEDVLVRGPVKERRAEPRAGALRWQYKTLVLMAAVILGVGAGAIASGILSSDAPLTSTEIAAQRTAHLPQHYEQLWQAQTQATYLEWAQAMTELHEQQRHQARIQQIHQLRAQEMAAYYARLWEEEHTN